VPEQQLPKPVYVYQDWEIDLGRRELRLRGSPVPMGSRAFEIIVVLVEAAGDPINKYDLMGRVWPGAVVEENTLQFHISAVRKALGPDREMLKTAFGRGYRLLGKWTIKEESPSARTSALEQRLTAGRPLPDNLPAAVPEPIGRAAAVGEIEARRLDSVIVRNTEQAGSNVAEELSLPDKPSVAVLPFQNMSGDPEQEYFADGMVEDIITALSRFKSLFVIARNSSFTYKGRAVDVRQVGRELGVRYVLEGSVRKVATRVRITGQLIDATNGMHLWAERFEGTLDDVFQLQDTVTAGVVSAIAPQVELAEIERASRKPTESLRAYDYYLRGLTKFHLATRTGLDEALPLFYKAIALDAEFASAYGMAAWCYYWRKMNRWLRDREADGNEAARLCRQAVTLGKNDAVALTRGGHT
jgi:TolB-like protein/DNA-binding winged helix-turn-helix (wHTH) protein